MKKIIFMLILLIPFFVYAECDSKVTISKLEFSEKKGYAEELEQSSYECNNIKLNIKMYNKDDSIIYNLTIKNNSDDDVELNNIFDSKSEYIVYKIEDKDLIVEKGKEKTFKLSATYNKLVSPTLLVNGTVEDNQVMNLSVTTKEEKNPNTNNVGIVLITVVLLLSIMTTMLLVLTKKEAPKYISLLIIPVLLIPVVAYALNKFELKLEAKVVLGEPKEKAIEPDNNQEPEEPQVTYVCKKATTLHTKSCAANSGGCIDTVGSGNTITYGTIPEGSLKAGDAYDCDVNNDGVYDAETERFYYLTTEDNKASFIYYNNIMDKDTSKQIATPYASQQALNNAGFECDSNYGCNHYGPVEAYLYLPTTTEWSNSKIIAPGTRQLRNEYGDPLTKDGKNEVNLNTFTYQDRAARFITHQEMEAVCGKKTYDNGYLDSCSYLMENTFYDDYNNLGYYWFETPAQYSNHMVYSIYAYSRVSISREPHTKQIIGVRPVITVNVNDIE